MNILKVFTKGGRQSIVRENMKKALTPEVAADWTAKAVNDSLMKSLKDVDDAKLKRVVGYCADGADLFKAVALAVEDKVITADEAADIYARIAKLADGVITQERVDALIETVVAKVP